MEKGEYTQQYAPEIAAEIVKNAPESVMDMTTQQYILHTTVRRNTRVTTMSSDDYDRAAQIFWQANKRDLHGGEFLPSEHTYEHAIDDRGVYPQHRGTMAGIHIMHSSWAISEKDQKHFANIKPENRLQYLETMARRDKIIQDQTGVLGAGVMLQEDMLGVPLPDLIKQAEDLKMRYPVAAFIARHFEAIGLSNAEDAISLLCAYNGTGGVHSQDEATRVMADLMNRGVIDENDHDLIVTTINGYTEQEMRDQLQQMKSENMMAEYLISVQNYLPEWGFSSVEELVDFVTQARAYTDREEFKDEALVIKQSMSAFSNRTDMQPHSAVQLYQYMHHLAKRKEDPTQAWQDILVKMGVPDSIPMVDLTALDETPHWLLRKIGMYLTHMNESYIRFGHNRHQLEPFSEFMGVINKKGAKNILLALTDSLIA